MAYLPDGGDRSESTDRRRRFCARKRASGGEEKNNL